MTLSADSFDTYAAHGGDVAALVDRLDDLLPAAAPAGVQDVDGFAARYHRYRMARDELEGRWRELRA